jgi:hypothetical protein
MKAVVVVALLAALSLQADKLPPVDESAQDPSFLAFKVRLLAALQRRDVTGLISALDPKVRVRFGAEEGIAAFRRHWKLDRPAQSRIWNELGTVLRLGATRDETDFVAPYVFTRFPPTLDAYVHVAVIRPGAELRRTAAAAAPKVGTLEFDIVQLVGGRRNGWVEVATADGRTGWLPEREIRSPMDYRAFFEKKNGQWKLTAFTTGD